MLKVSRLHIHRFSPSLSGNASSMSLRSWTLASGRAVFAMPDLRADAMALKFVSQPEEHTKLRHLKLRDQRKLLGLLSQHVVTAALASRAPGTARAPAWDSRRSFYALYRFGRLRWRAVRS
jgi:hypothetical protein